jgi:hypothetical protein
VAGPVPERSLRKALRRKATCDCGSEPKRAAFPTGVARTFCCKRSPAARTRARLPRRSLLRPRSRYFEHAVDPVQACEEHEVGDGADVRAHAVARRQLEPVALVERSRQRDGACLVRPTVAKLVTGSTAPRTTPSRSCARRPRGWAVQSRCELGALDPDPRGRSGPMSSSLCRSFSGLGAPLPAVATSATVRCPVSNGVIA